MNKVKAFVSFVIYAYNDSTIFESFFNMLSQYATTFFEQCEFVVVDDCSTDNTVRVVERLLKNIQSLTIVKMGYHQGLDLSMNAGVDCAIGDFVFEFDTAIVDYSIDDIHNTFKLCLEGYDIVAACPNKARGINSRIFYAIYNKFSRNGFCLKTDSFRILSRRAINRIRSMSDSRPYRKAVYANSGLPIINYEYPPTCICERKKRTLRFNTAINALILYTNVASAVAIGVSVLLFVFSLLITAYAIVIRIKGVPIEGWTSIVLIISILLLGISILITILIKYSEIILKTVFMNQKYVIKSIDRISK